jgi:Group II intron, maturase-specific domain
MDLGLARPEDRHFLGFCLRLVQHGRGGTVEVGLSERTKRNAMAGVRQLTPRTWGGTLDSAIARINAWLRGWHQFFGIASAEEQQQMRRINAHIRRRLRAIVLHHWKRQRTIARRPRRARRQTAECVARGLRPQAPDVGPQPCPGRRSRSAQRVFRRLRADLGG